MKSFKYLIFLFYLTSYLSIEAQNLKKYSSCKLKTSNFTENLTYTFENNVIIIKDVRIKGTTQKFNFILDSGSEYTLISKRVAKEIGFTADFSEEITDGYEKQKIQLGFANFKIQNIEFNSVGVGIIDNSQMEKICNIDGYIGYNLMKSCIWQLSTGQIIITDDIKNIKNVRNYNKQKLFNGPTVEAGFTNGFNSTMLFDLGDNGTVEIQESRIDLIKKKEIATGTGILYTTGLGVGNKNESSVHKLLKVPSFKFGNNLVKNMIVYTDNAPHFPIDIIGAGILNYFEIVLDFPKKRIYSLNVLDEYKSEGYKTHGFKYTIVNNEMIITYIWNNSPAYKAGLRVGEKITKLHGLKIKDLSNLDNCEIYKRIDTIMDIDTINIVLSSNNENITLTKSPLFNTQ